MNETFECPFCHEEHEVTGEHIWFFCLGEFPLNWLRCKDYIKQKANGDTNKLGHLWAVLRYHISHTYLFVQRQPGQSLYPVDYEQILKQDILPSPIEQIDDLISFAGMKSHFWGQKIDLNWGKPKSLYHQLKAWVGTSSDENLIKVIEEAQHLQLIESHLSGPLGLSQLELKLKGWERFKTLQKRTSSSKQIFMAMEFNEEAKNFVNTHLKPLTKEMGFELKLLNEIINEKSLIDDKLRVEIKKSRLLICDLSHGNQGAYWESGYAEGLGIHVLYICHQNVLNSRSKAKRPHFDVNHQEIFTWADDESSIADFKEQLKAKIALLTQ